MKKEDKELLFKDLCARLPYCVQIHIDLNKIGHIVGDATLNTITSITGQLFDFTDFKQDFKNGDCCPISGFSSNKLLHLEEFKPYLRPMSSMTEEEKDIYDRMVMCNESWVVTDWLNKNGFDYWGLIPMGLALEDKEGMYNIK